MKLVHGVQDIAAFKNGVAATIGNFDGVHVGHQQLIHYLKNKAQSMRLPSVVILFEPQPREYFQKDNAPVRLSSLRDKLELLKALHIDYVYCIKFDTSFSQTSAKDFIAVYLQSILHVKYLLIGHDFQFGYNREGNISLLKEMGAHYNCDVDTYPEYCVKNQRVSSTKIRTALHESNMELATELLGRTYGVCGRVVRGDGRGREWGIPTANIGLFHRALPIRGVFAVQVRRGTRTFFGVANAGKRPTVDGTKNILEIHLFDFNDSLYGELLHVSFLKKLRDEVKFVSIDALIQQIHEDIVAAKGFLNLNV